MSKRIQLTDFAPDDKNFNKHSQYGMTLLEKSVESVGVIESITVSADDKVISGNARQEVMAQKFADVEPIVIETDGTRPVILKRTDIKSDTKEFFESALLANTVSMHNVNLDYEKIEEVLVQEYDVNVETLGVPSEEFNGDELDVTPEKKLWTPDCLFASDNMYDIPTLLMPEGKVYVDLPLKPYGAEKRSKQGVGTYHFYVDDYRFEAIWNKPDPIIESGCKAIVEPNCSLYETTPLSFGIFQIYRKRWIARFLQDFNINVFVDLNVTEKFLAYNSMGVPKGYNAFFTRGYEGRIKALENELNVAKDISGLDNPNLIVYGGSKAVKEFCAKNNLTFINNTTLDLA